MHLSHTPIIGLDKQLQTYIRGKLGMGKILERQKLPFSTNEILRERLEKDWIYRDKLQSECNVVEKISQYYSNLQVQKVGGCDEHLVLQRTIGFPSLIGN